MPDSRPRLNIVLHGMFVILVDISAESVILLPPETTEHRYGIYQDASQLLQKGIDYNLTGLRRTTTAKKYVRPHISWKDSNIDHYVSGKEYCGIKIPALPDEIWPLRFNPGKDIFDSNSAVVKENKLNDLGVPLVHVLSYTGVDRSNPPALNDNKGAIWSPASGQDFYKLHICAELLADSAGHTHLKHMIALVNGMFVRNSGSNLDLAINDNSSGIDKSIEPDTDTHHDSVLPSDEKGLVEDRSRVFSLKVRNCMSLLFVK